MDRNSIPFIGLDIATSLSSESSSSDDPPRVLDSALGSTKTRGAMPSGSDFPNFDDRDFFEGSWSCFEDLEATMSDEAVVRAGKASRDCAIESDQE